MEKKVPLFYRGIPVGFITVTYRGSRMTLQAECPETAKGVLRAYACSRNDPTMRLLVGVMEPESGVLCARRVYTRNDLQSRKILTEQIDTGELVRYSSMEDTISGIRWKKCNAPQKLFSDYALESSLKDAEGILTDRDENPGCVAAPFDKDTGFALAPAFCLVQAVKIDDARYGIIGRTADGLPIKFDDGQQDIF